MLDYNLVNDPSFNANPHWKHAPKQLLVLPQTLSGLNLKILEPGPYNGFFSQEFVKQGHNVTAVEPWLGPDARFNSLTELHDQLVVDRRPIELFLKQDTVSHWDVVFAIGLLYHVPSPLHLLDLFAERGDHVYIDTYPWCTDAVTVLLPGNTAWSDHNDHKKISLACAPNVLNYYMTTVLGWSRGWQGIQIKVSGHPAWTAYYHKNTVPALRKAQVTHYHMTLL